MIKGLRYLFTLALPVGLLAVGAGYLLDIRGAGTPLLTYDTVEATRGSIRKIVTTSGPVRALVTVSIGSQLSGQVKDVVADFNSEVKAGDLIAALDAKTFEAKVLAAKADLAAARASLLNQEALLKKSEAVLRLAERTKDRTTTLAGRGFSAQSALETAVRDTEVATAEIDVARAMIENAKATVAQRQAAVDQAQIDLDRTRINSPIDGTVISRTVDPGQTVAASLQAPELFKIAQDLRRIRLEAQVNEADVGTIAEGNPVTFSVDAYPDRQFEGRVTQVRLAAVELNSVVTYTVIIEASNDDRKLFPGMTANVQIEAARKDDTLRVPNDALRFRPRGEAAVDQGRGKGEGRGGSNAERAERRIERIKTELQLTAEQEDVLRRDLQTMFAEMRRGGGMGGPDTAQSDPGQIRQRLAQRVEQVIGPILTAEQRPLFEKWKAGRESVKPGNVWILGPQNTLERRSVRFGIADDQFTEIVGGQLKDGDRIIVRAREAKS